MILPGFIDSHLHPFTGAIQLKKCRVFKFASWAIAAEEITKYID
jgi:predicted amidohydrolase YtcJ